METNLAGTRDGISERFAPDQDRGRLIEVEHVCRYLWAAQLAEGRRVLDAACGTAYGSRMLARAGASEVVGVDIAQDVLEAVAPAMPANVHLQAQDLRRLEFEDDRFELVVCFEAIEHFHDPLEVLDELVRVLSPDGLLVVSSPNRGHYPPDNPHHFHEFTHEELADALRQRLPSVSLARQSDYIVSALLEDEAVARGDGEPVGDLAVHKLNATVPGQETYTVALAGHGQLPPMRQLAAMSGTLEMREWLSVFKAQADAIAVKESELTDLHERLAERDELARLLTDAEQRLAQIPELKLRIADLEHEVGEARAAADAARREAWELDQILMYGRRALRYVRPLIGPLRQVRRRLRG